MKSTIYVCILAVAAWCLPAPADATLALELSQRHLVYLSSTIVRGTVSKIESRWAPQGGQIYTYTTLQVDEPLKNDRETAPKTVVIRQIGGTVDGITQKVAGDASFEMGQQVVVFLRRNTEGEDVYFLTGMSQSKFTLFRNEGQDYVLRSMKDLAFVRVNGPGLAQAKVENAPAESPIRLADFRAGVLKLVEEQRAGVPMNETVKLRNFSPIPPAPGQGKPNLKIIK
ncbi:MAG: hypothetical protein GMKNLPBB_01897 [Myxococcota bacterium]|nr:hypothetical protein [Myxococcota bacterium]